MNTFDYKRTDENGLSFILPVDGEPLFQDFGLDCSLEGHKKVFAFSRANYDDIIARIAADAHDFRARGWK